MHKETYSEWIDAWLTGDLEPERADAVAAHAAGCPECRRQVNAVRAAMGALSAEEPDAGCGQERARAAVMTAIARARHRRAWLRRGVYGTAVAAAAAALFSLSSRLVMRFTPRSGPVFSVAWSRGGEYVADRQDRPIVIDRMVFAMRREGGVYRMDALDADTGVPVWQTDISPVHAVVSHDNAIYTASREGDQLYLVRIDPLTGHQSRVLTVESETALSRQIRLADLPGRILIRDGNRLICYDTARASAAWETSRPESEGMISLPVAGPDGTIALAAARHWLILDADSGAVRDLRPHPHGLSRYRAPQVIGDGNYGWIAAHRADGKGYLARIDLRDGSVTWKKQASSPYQVQRIGDILLVRGDGLRACRADTGENLWTLPIRGCDRVAFHGGKILAFDGQDRKRILAIEPNTGKQAFHADFADSSCGGISVFGHRGYLISNGGRLYALAL